MTDTIQIHAQELARSNGDLEQFAYIASHDLRAPLRGIDHLATWIEADLGDSLTGEPREHMTQLRARIKRLEALLNDLLNFSRAGREEADVETIDVEELILGQFNWLNIEENFELVLDTDVKSISLRRTALEQIFGNLFSNAFKHHDRGKGRLEVAVKDDGKYYMFTVADDGPGIPPEFHARVFQMFQTLQPRDDVEGSGMGLAIIRKIIEREGGSIAVENQPGGRGALFRFFLKKSTVETREK
jgi:signal transduction histidine kinase